MKTIRAAALAAAATLCASGTALAQEHWTDGPVWQCTFMHVSQENWDKYMLYLRRNTLPLMQAQQKAGLMLDWRTYVKSPEGPDDWNWVGCTLHKSYGDALDFRADEDAKMKEIAKTHWKTADEAAQRTAAAERFALRRVVGTSIMRQIDFRPLP